MQVWQLTFDAAHAIQYGDIALAYRYLEVRALPLYNVVEHIVALYSNAISCT